MPTLQQKIEQFKAEIGTRQLNVEQQRVYNAFVYRRVKPYKFVVNDRYGNTIRFTLYTNKNDDGVVHILSRHYKSRVGEVTALEILNFCDIIRNGELKTSNSGLTYCWIKGANVYTLKVGLKVTKTAENILKSIYSNKKVSSTAGSRTYKMPVVPITRNRCKGTTKRRNIASKSYKK